MNTALDTQWTAFLASEPGPKAWQIAKVAVKKPELRERALTALLAIDDKMRGEKIDALCHIMSDIPEARSQIWPEAKRLLEQYNFGNYMEKLVLLMLDGKGLREEIWELIGDKLRVSQLDEAIKRSPDLHERAWARRKMHRHNSSSCSEFDVGRVIKYLTPTEQDEAWEMMTRAGRDNRPTYTHLAEVFHRAPHLRAKAFEELKRQGYLGRLTMVEIFVQYPQWREAAFEQILIHGDDVRHLPYEVEERLLGVMANKGCQPPERQRAWDELCRRKLWAEEPDHSSFDGHHPPFIMRVMHDVPRLREEAWEIFRPTATPDQLVWAASWIYEITVRCLDELERRPNTPAEYFLCQTFTDNEKLRERSFRLALKRKPTNEELVRLFFRLPNEQERIVTRLIDRKDSDQHLLTIMNQHPELTATIAPVLFARGTDLTQSWLDHIEKRAPQLRDEIEKRRRPVTESALKALLAD